MLGLLVTGVLSLLVTLLVLWLRPRVLSRSIVSPILAPVGIVRVILIRVVRVMLGIRSAMLGIRRVLLVGGLSWPNSIDTMFLDKNLILVCKIDRAFCRVAGSRRRLAVVS